MSRTHQFLVTLTVHTNKINPANKPTTTSANSMTNKTAVVVTRRDGQHPETHRSHETRCASNPGCFILAEKPRTAVPKPVRGPLLQRCLLQLCVE
ncbi:hypothetical protein I553_3520 [Mycobacterium xenopi 4042]|uniref:Uncharacterized protein n=1 Tax=Mycobacterium xenopi 4042 TaxID=1299334 RepID=X7ZWP9_MYCXE|nr:hypothetical protein I553_3520 [Mycobacterium xenopi 4042]